MTVKFSYINTAVPGPIGKGELVKRELKTTDAIVMGMNNEDLSFQDIDDTAWILRLSELKSLEIS
jgi:hypothetical protein